MEYKFEGVQYIPDSSGTAEKVKCPLVDDFIEAIDCMENQELSENSIPSRFRVKKEWRNICESCPFRNY